MSRHSKKSVFTSVSKFQNHYIQTSKEYLSNTNNSRLDYIPITLSNMLDILVHKFNNSIRTINYLLD